MYLCAGVPIVMRNCLLHAHVSRYHLVDYIDRAVSYYCFVDGSWLEVFWSISIACVLFWFNIRRVFILLYLPHFFTAFLESMRSRILPLSLPWEVGIEMYEGASVVGACSGTPLVYLKTRLGRFCLLIVFGLFKILHLHREVILSKCLYLCLHRSEWLGLPTWYHQAKSHFLYFLSSSHWYMGKRKGPAVVPRNSSPCLYGTRKSCYYSYRVSY